MRIAFLVGLLVIGNIIDNISSPKRLAIALQLALAVVWAATGLMVAYIREQQKEHPGKLPDEADIFYMFVKLQGFAQILAAG